MHSDRPAKNLIKFLSLKSCAFCLLQLFYQQYAVVSFVVAVGNKPCRLVISLQHVKIVQIVFGVERVKLIAEFTELFFVTIHI